MNGSSKVISLGAYKTPVKTEFHPIQPPINYSPSPPQPVIKTPHLMDLPSYLQFWSYFPLKQVTPDNIQNGIRTASQNVYYDGKLKNFETLNLD